MAHTKTGFFGDPESNGFSTKKIRSDFVAKVYSLVCTMLSFTLASMALAMFVEPVKQHLIQYGIIYSLIALVFLLCLLCTLACTRSALRTYPTNYIFLGIITFLYSVVVACFVVYYKVEAVMIAIGITFGVCAIVYILAAYSPMDMTGFGRVLYILLMAHLILGIVLGLILIPMGHYNVYNIIYSTLGAFLFSAYLMMDLQLIMGGRTYEMSPEDHVWAAIALYTDIINIFLNILSVTKSF